MPPPVMLLAAEAPTLGQAMPGQAMLLTQAFHQQRPVTTMQHPDECGCNEVLLQDAGRTYRWCAWTGQQGVSAVHLNRASAVHLNRATTRSRPGCVLLLCSG